MKQPRVLLSIYFLIMFTGIAMAKQSEETTPPIKLPDNKGRAILGATVADDGQIIVITEEYEKSEEKNSKEECIIRFLECEPNGVIRDMSVFATQDAGIYIADDLPATGKGRNITLGYTDYSHYVHFLRLKKGGIEKEDIALKLEEGDSASECFFLAVGNEQKLFIQINLPWSRQIPHLSYNWIYCYRFDNGKPVLETKAVLEKWAMSSDQIKCAPAGDDVLIWQTFYNTSNTDIKTVRVAKWKKSGRLKWKKLYTGENSGFTIDPNDGSKAILWAEGKETKDGRLRYVQYAVGPGITKPIPIDTSRSGVILRLLRVPAKQTWVGATEYRKSVVITVFDDNFVEQTVKTFATNKVEDIALAEKDGKCYLIVLGSNEVIIKDIDTLPELTPKEK